jgi:putative transposase
MARKKYTPENIIQLLRQAEILIGKGTSAEQASKSIGVSYQTFLRWRKEYGGMRTDQAKRLKELENENNRLKKIVAELELDKHMLKERSDQEELIQDVVKLASRYGRYGYRRITALLRSDGWRVNHKRVYRIWRKEGLKVPKKHSKRGRLWFDNGSCIRKRPEFNNHVWSYDFVAERTKDGRSIKMLNIIDEFSRECLAIEVKRRMKSKDVKEVLGNLFLERGTPVYVRSDNGPEFIANELKKWFKSLGVQPLYMEVHGRMATASHLMLA